MPKKFMVIKATTKDIDHVNVGGKDLKFSRKTGGFQVADAGVASEINAMYGAKSGQVSPDVVVVPIENAGRDPLHRSLFTVPDLPWKNNP
jgi:hypothetical protein